jgi:hypothetical protein
VVRTGVESGSVSESGVKALEEVLEDHRRRAAPMGGSAAGENGRVAAWDSSAQFRRTSRGGDVLIAVRRRVGRGRRGRRRPGPGMERRCPHRREEALWERATGTSSPRLEC